GAPASLVGQVGIFAAAEGAVAAILRLDKLRRSLDQIERAFVAFLVVVSPIDEPMLAEQDAARVWSAGANIADGQTKFESRPQPRRVGDLVAPNDPRELLGMSRGGDRYRGIRM